eukprot:2494462-Prymnesium_polylepis.1
MRPTLDKAAAASQPNPTQPHPQPNPEPEPHPNETTPSPVNGSQVTVKVFELSERLIRCFDKPSATLET